MREAVWGYAVIVLGILAIGIIWFFANSTKTDQHNYNLLKETVEASMFDAVDLAAYRSCETNGMTTEEFKKVNCIKIDEEKFVENFIRRFAESADLSNTYVIEIYDINEAPPKVSLKVSSTKETTATGEIMDFNIVNNIDAILETKYKQDPEENSFEEENEIDFSERVDSQNIYGCKFDTTISKRFKKGENQRYEFDVVSEEGCTAEIKKLELSYKSNTGGFSGEDYRISCDLTNSWNTISCSFDCYEEYCEVQVSYNVEFGRLR